MRVAKRLGSNGGMVLVGVAGASPHGHLRLPCPTPGHEYASIPNRSLIPPCGPGAYNWHSDGDAPPWCRLFSVPSRCLVSGPLEGDSVLGSDQAYRLWSGAVVWMKSAVAFCYTTALCNKHRILTRIQGAPMVFQRVVGVRVLIMLFFTCERTWESLPSIIVLVRKKTRI